MRRLPKYKQKATMFIDECCFDLKRQGKETVFAVTGGKLPPKTSPHARKKARFHLHYLGAVMHGVGSVAFIPLTGTTDKPKVYTVGDAPSPTTLT